MTVATETRTHVVVYIAVGTLHPKFGASLPQRGPNCDDFEDAERYGLRMLAEDHWSTFVIEHRYYPKRAEA